MTCDVPRSTSHPARSGWASRRDATRIRAWLQDGRDVYIYYNNDAEGHAVDNAKRLKELMA